MKLNYTPNVIVTNIILQTVIVTNLPGGSRGGSNLRRT